MQVAQVAGTMKSAMASSDIFHVVCLAHRHFPRNCLIPRTTGLVLCQPAEVIELANFAFSSRWAPLCKKGLKSRSSLFLCSRGASRGQRSLYNQVFTTHNRWQQQRRQQWNCVGIKLGRESSLHKVQRAPQTLQACSSQGQPTFQQGLCPSASLAYIDHPDRTNERSTFEPALRQCSGSDKKS